MIYPSFWTVSTLISIFSASTPISATNFHGNTLDLVVTLCITKETINKMKRPPTEWENMFGNDTSEKGLTPKIYEEFIQLNTHTHTHTHTTR